MQTLIDSKGLVRWPSWIVLPYVPLHPNCLYSIFELPDWFWIYTLISYLRIHNTLYHIFIAVCNKAMSKLLTCMAYILWLIVPVTNEDLPEQACMTNDIDWGCGLVINNILDVISLIYENLVEKRKGSSAQTATHCHTCLLVSFDRLRSQFTRIDLLRPQLLWQMSG